MKESTMAEIGNRLQMFFDTAAPGAKTSINVIDGKVKIIVALPDKFVFTSSIIPEYFDSHWRDCLRTVFKNYTDYLAEKVLNENIK